MNLFIFWKERPFVVDKDSQGDIAQNYTLPRAWDFHWCENFAEADKFAEKNGWNGYDMVYAASTTDWKPDPPYFAGYTAFEVVQGKQLTKNTRPVERRGNV